MLLLIFLVYFGEKNCNLIFFLGSNNEWTIMCLFTAVRCVNATGSVNHSNVDRTFP